MKEKLIDYWTSEKIITDKKLLKAFQEVQREDFVRPGENAYGDYPLPIGYEQTISQPTTVMIMTQALELKKTDKVLEIGTGSGYQAAILSKLAKEVISTELIPELVEFAKDNLKRCHIENVEVILHDGSQGYKPGQPYDAIIVTAACPRIPEPLISQLKSKGRLVAPVGPLYSQVMVKLTKGVGTENLGSFVFVPLRGKYGFENP